MLTPPRLPGGWKPQSALTPTEKAVYDIVHGPAHIGYIRGWYAVTDTPHVGELSRLTKVREKIAKLDLAICDIERSYRSKPNHNDMNGARPTTKLAIEWMTHHAAELFRAGFILDSIHAQLENPGQILTHLGPYTEAVLLDAVKALDGMRVKYASKQASKAISAPARADLRSIQQKLVTYYRFQTAGLPEPDHELTTGIVSAAQHRLNSTE